MLVGLPLRGERVFKPFAWLEVGPGKEALSRPAWRLNLAKLTSGYPLAKNNLWVLCKRQPLGRWK